MKRAAASGSGPLVYAVLLGFCFIAGASTDTPQGPGFTCQEGCRKTFKPVCGVDGRTYSSACIATCQEVPIVHQDPCPGEAILHPANKHVVTGVPAGDEDDSAGHPADQTTPSSSSAHRLTRHHLDAFRHEGFRYSGQITFTNTLAPKPRGGVPPHSQQSQQQQQAARSSQQPRLIRVTREGHMYTADLDESVDTVLDSLIERHTNATSGLGYGGSGHNAAHVQAMLLTLRQWRAYRPRGGKESKWAPRHTVVAPRGAGAGGVGPGEHPLQPGLDAAAGMAGQFAVQGPQTEGRQRQQGEEEEEDDDGVAVPGAIAAPDSEAGDTEDAEQQGTAAGSKRTWGLGLGFGGGGGGQKRGEEVKQQHEDHREGGPHRQARRSLGIFDTDDRVDCPRTPTYPFTAMGQISIRDPSGNYVCSGALVGPDVVLTAAHCVFSRSSQTFYAKLDFAPARYRTTDGQVVNPYGVIAWTYVTVYQGYTTATTPDPNVEDIAVINLSQRIGTQAGWMGVFEPCSPFAPTRYVALTAGYPSDQPAGSCKTTQCVVVQDPCTDGYLYHKCDTASGQSGSPMYMMAMTSARKMGPYIRAVHNIEWVQENANGQMVSYINSAVSITPDHYRSILAWIGLSFSSDGTTPMTPATPPSGNSSTATTNSTSNSSATAIGRR